MVDLMTNKLEAAKRIGIFPMVIFLTIALLLVAIFTLNITPDALDDIIQHKTLRVVTRNGPTTYYLEDGIEQGFEFELAQDFAKYLGVELELHRLDSLKEIIDKTSLGGTHIASAGLGITKQRTAQLSFSNSYYEVEAIVIYRSGEAKPRSLDDLIGKTVAVIKDSAHAEYLSQAQITHPDLNWIEFPQLESLDFLEMVRDFHFDYAVVDSNEFEVNRQLFPSLSKGLVIGQPQPLAWAVMPGNLSERLLIKINDFLAASEHSGRLNELRDKYYGNHSDISRGSANTFAKRVEKVLPKYIALIKQIATEESLDWQLLAAISYQESHWNPKATSPTGVRGMMMLTLITMRELGLDSRLDPEQSLRGGARYFKSLHERLPARISEPDRTSLALAAYNVGLGHLEDARVITQRQGKNPDLWEDVKQHLPLLQKRRWYSKTKYGFARGQEPVDYVANIRHYESYLRWQEINTASKKLEGTIENEPQQLPEQLQKGLNPL